MTEADEIRNEARRNTRGRFEQWAKNPTCAANTVSAVHNVRLDKVAAAAGLDPSFGQSPFAITRGDRFEAGLFFDDAQRLREALERKGALPAGSAGLLDLRLRMNRGTRIASIEQALSETAAWLQRLADDPASAESIVAAPMVKIPRGVILPEALLIIDAVTVVVADDGRARLTVGEIKVFPDRGGHTDPQQLAAARAQAGLYRHAFALAIDALGLADDIGLATDGLLVFTWPGSNSPSVRVGEDLRYQTIRADRGFDRLEEVAQEVVRDDDFSADNPTLIDRVLHAETDYSEACLSFCDLAPRCHQRALEADAPVVLGGDVKRLLGDTTLTRAIALLGGAAPADEREADLQRQLQTASVTAVARKLQAWEAGRPLPRYDTIHRALVPPGQTMIVAFVRMAGESRPWGIAWGAADTDPTIRSVPDGRVRDDVAELAAAFAEDLLQHCRVHNWTYDPVAQDADPGDLRQIWLPNGQHAAMLHQLSYTYSQTRFGGTNQDILRALGRLCGWMFRDTARAGSQHVVSASALLGELFAFPAQDARTAHLGFQLGWLTGGGDRARRLAAAGDAEQLTVSPTMDPSLERDELSELVDAWQAGRRTGSGTDEPAAAIAAILDAELRRRWDLTEAAYRLITTDGRPVNAGVSELVRKAHQEFWFQHQRIELRLSDPSQGPAFVAHPETDFHGSAAASRYLFHAAADEAHAGQLVHDDPALFSEAERDGHALRATVVEVSDVGSGRTTIPQWLVRLDPSRPNRLRESARLVPYGSRGHEATVMEIEATDTDLFVTLHWTTRKTKPLSGPLDVRLVDASWEGVEVAFVQSDAAALTERRSRRVWTAKDGPGAWLTHAKPSAPIEISDDDGSADLIVDDVTQIEGGGAA